MRAALFEMKVCKGSLKQILLLFIFVAKSFGVEKGEMNDLERFTYNAAVVEYQPIQNTTMSPQEKQNFTVHDYIRLLKEIKEDIDIIIFPESTLTSLSHPLNAEDVTEVPEPFSEILCNSSNSKYLHFLKKLSCAAVETNTTVVINLTEKENCTMNDSPEFCPSTGFVYYNSDVILNEEGSVSARYRKVNLFGEAGITPAQEEAVNFTIRNNVSFGIFTCFDILFEKPALKLVRNGIRNILFPTMWFSELPYLTALQAQQMWAQENNVTFLSSGANNPRVGSGGSAIFVGNKGPVNYTIVSGIGGTQVLVQRVPKIDIPGNPYVNEILPLQENVDILAEELDDFHLKQDHSVIDEHASLVLNIDKNETKEEVCHGNKDRICCQFHIKIKPETNDLEGKNSYTYHLAAFNGQRHFRSRFGGIEACSVLACLNDSITSCGLRFPKFKDVQWPVTFEYINITAEFQISDERIQFPNSLLASLRPISPQYTSWIRVELGHKVKRSHILNKPQNRLLTFAIYGRDFVRDLPSFSEKLRSKNNVIALSCILSVLVTFNKI